MSGRLHTIEGVRIFECGVEGPMLAGPDDALTILSESFEHRPDWTAIPLARIDDEFFDLGNRRAGESLQKFVNYRARVAVVGDLSDRIARSTAFRDFVRESNRGNQLWFVADMNELQDRVIERTARPR